MAWGIFCKMWYYFVIVIGCAIIMGVAVISAVGGNSVIDNAKRATDTYQSGLYGTTIMSDNYGSATYQSTDTSNVTRTLFGTLILTIIPFVLIVVFTVFGVMKLFYYALGPYIMYDSGNKLKGREAAEKSKELMENMRGNGFVLLLSFIGWALLAWLAEVILTVIVLQITNWTPLLNFVAFIPRAMVIAYMLVSTVIFYEELSGKGKKEVVAEVTEATETTDNNNQ